MMEAKHPHYIAINERWSADNAGFYALELFWTEIGRTEIRVRRAFVQNAMQILASRDGI